MIELVKAVGGISWAVGLIMLFAEPSLGLLILLFALVATLYVRAKDREKKHKELLQATEKGHRPVVTAAPPSVSERLTELARLRDAGTIKEGEYEAKRKNILDSL